MSNFRTFTPKVGTVPTESISSMGVKDIVVKKTADGTIINISPIGLYRVQEGTGITFEFTLTDSNGDQLIGFNSDAIDPDGLSLPVTRVNGSYNYGPFVFFNFKSVDGVSTATGSLPGGAWTVSMEQVQKSLQRAGLNYNINANDIEFLSMSAGSI